MERSHMSQQSCGYVTCLLLRGIYAEGTVKNQNQNMNQIFFSMKNCSFNMNLSYFFHSVIMMINYSVTSLNSE